MKLTHLKACLGLYRTAMQPTIYRQRFKTQRFSLYPKGFVYLIPSINKMYQGGTTLGRGSTAKISTQEQNQKNSGEHTKTVLTQAVKIPISLVECEHTGRVLIQDHSLEH